MSVGFIRDLPKELMGAFKTTLEELQDADVLLHMADASSPDLEGQIEAVEKTLSDLRLADIPRLLVLNKMDRVHTGDIEALCNRYQAVAVSAVEPHTLSPLIESLDRSIRPNPSSHDHDVPRVAEV